MNNEVCKNWYQASYGDLGLAAQRQYPNEELCRFMGRHFFRVPLGERKSIRILEIGCGTCANLWMIAKEGFDTYGIDLAATSVQLAWEMLQKFGIQRDAKNVHLAVEDMTKLSFEPNFFDAVVDVFSSYCLTENQYVQCLNEIKRVLKPNGLYFCYTPGKKSDAFLHYNPAKKIDSSTLNGIYRQDSPFYGNSYPFRFANLDDMNHFLNCDFELLYAETCTRSYFERKENFEFLIVEAQKRDY